jgi:hypothetical protein
MVRKLKMEDPCGHWSGLLLVGLYFCDTLFILKGTLRVKALIYYLQ